MASTSGSDRWFVGSSSSNTSGAPASSTTSASEDRGVVGDGTESKHRSAPGRGQATLGQVGREGAPHHASPAWRKRALAARFASMRRTGSPRLAGAELSDGEGLTHRADGGGGVLHDILGQDPHDDEPLELQ